MLNRLLCLFFIFASIGCSKTATITRADGRPIEALVVGSTPSTIDIRIPLTGGIERLDRDSIVDVDHPGNVHMVVGGSLASIGVLPTAFGAMIVVTANDSFNRFFGSVSLAMGGSILAAGLPPLIWGYNTWTDSKGYFGDQPATSPKVRNPRIVVIPVTDGRSVGLSIGGSF